jgi:hypothetical protein
MPVDLKRLRVVHYLNQFFGKEGGEEKAHIPFLVKEGPLGPGMALQKILGERGEVVSTLVCGDNYLSQDVEKASREGVELIVPYKPDLVIAGPAFEAGRYGVACGAMCKASRERLGIPAVTGMFKENPGVELYRKEVYICKTERRPDSHGEPRPEAGFEREGEKAPFRRDRRETGGGPLFPEGTDQERDRGEDRGGAKRGDVALETPGRAFSA